MIKIKSDRADILASARAAVEARKKYKKSLLKKQTKKSAVDSVKFNEKG